MINLLVIQGNLVRDVEQKAVSDVWNVAKFSIAVNSWKKDPQGNWKEGDASFFDCVWWYKQILPVMAKLLKGKKIIVEGKLRQERWQDKTNGEQRSKVVIIVESVVLCEIGDKPNESNGSNGSQWNPEDVPF